MLRSILFLLLTLPLAGEISSAPTIENLIKKAEGSYWIVVDLDNTLFEGKEAFGHAHWYEDKYKKLLDQGLSKAEALSECHPLWLESQSINNVQPVEDKLIEWIKEQQSKGVVVLGITTRQPILQTCTERQLKSLGLNLVTTSPKAETQSIFQHPTAYANGVLYCHDLNDQEAVFSSFLKVNRLNPSKVLFVDDQLHHVEDLEKALKENGIEMIGLHYTAVAEKEPVYQATVAEFQQQKLHSILSNDEALLLLHHQPDIHQ
jgi:FMN phosphatase YigB (HAD superfamily)